jgi:hypothetical protein
MQAAWGLDSYFRFTIKPMWLFYPVRNISGDQDNHKHKTQLKLANLVILLIVSRDQFLYPSVDNSKPDILAVSSFAELII